MILIQEWVTWYIYIQKTPHILLTFLSQYSDYRNHDVILLYLYCPSSLIWVGETWNGLIVIDILILFKSVQIIYEWGEFCQVGIIHQSDCSIYAIKYYTLWGILYHVILVCRWPISTVWNFRSERPAIKYIFQYQVWKLARKRK